MKCMYLTGLLVYDDDAISQVGYKDLISRVCDALDKETMRML